MAIKKVTTPKKKDDGELYVVVCLDADCCSNAFTSLAAAKKEAQYWADDDQGSPVYIATILGRVTPKPASVNCLNVPVL